jgi:hypothetical protein
LAIIYFSGHGTFIEDNNGDEKDDCWDELFVTYDSKCNSNPKDDDGWRDDDFVKLANDLPTNRVLTVMDTCYSSGMLLGSSLPHPLLANARSKFLVKGDYGTADICPRSDEKSVLEKEVGNLDSLKGLLLAAADEGQTAQELSAGGLFTVKLVEQLGQSADFKEAFLKTTQEVQEMTQKTKSPQTPQAEGNWKIVEENRRIRLSIWEILN